MRTPEEQATVDLIWDFINSLPMPTVEELQARHDKIEEEMAEINEQTNN